MAFDVEREIKKTSKAEAQEGKLKNQNEEDKLMHSVLNAEKKTIDQAEIIQEATNKNVGSFTPDMMFENMVQNYQMTEKLYGPKLIKLLSGFDSGYIKRNVKIPEFKKLLKEQLQENFNQMVKDKIVDKKGEITTQGYGLAGMVLVQELDQYITKDSVGEKVNKRQKHYGERTGFRNYRKGDRYKDINLRRSVSTAVRRMHSTLHFSDLMTSEREGRGTISVILALDASASMRGAKLETCKRAGIALAHKAISDQDKVGLVVFGSKVKKSVPPIKDFGTIVKYISTIRASSQTDFAKSITKSIELFEPRTETKHLIIVTDALPTAGDEPEKATLAAASAAQAAGITISIIGIKLDYSGAHMAQRITQIGEGKLSSVRQLSQLGHFMLEDYYGLKR